MISKRVDEWPLRTKLVYRRSEGGKRLPRLSYSHVRRATPDGLLACRQKPHRREAIFFCFYNNRIQGMRNRHSTRFCRNVKSHRGIAWFLQELRGVELWLL